MAAPTTAYEMVASTKGPPRAAPTPISFCAASRPKTTATKGHCAFRQSGAEGGENGAGGGFPDPEFSAQPLDAVDEEFAREVNRRRRPEDKMTLSIGSRRSDDAGIRMRTADGDRQCLANEVNAGTGGGGPLSRDWLACSLVWTISPPPPML